MIAPSAVAPPSVQDAPPTWALQVIGQSQSLSAQAAAFRIHRTATHQPDAGNQGHPYLSKHLP